MKTSIKPSDMVVTKQSFEMRKANGFKPFEFIIQISYRVTQSGKFEYLKMCKKDLISFMSENGFKLLYRETYAGDKIYSIENKVSA